MIMSRTVNTITKLSQLVTNIDAMENINLNPQIKKEQDEAKDVLQNGIFVETSNGLICVSLDDALLADINLSAQDLENVAKTLILKEKPENVTKNLFPLPFRCTFDSDGFSSECSDGSAVSISSSITANSIIPDSKIHRVNSTSSKPISTVISSKATLPPKIVPNTTTTTIRINGKLSQINYPQCKPLSMKKRGGWPKGRKRKPELLNLPPKAPATGYNLYLNEQRKYFKNTALVFHEITKILGNNWSNLTLADKQPYLAKAEEDKRRYREELKQYRQSEAYRTYLAKKRKNRLLNNIMSESDMDATDEIDEEDNEELYCRTCDQWFHNMHNKKEHLQGKQHMQTLANHLNKTIFNEVNTNVTENSNPFDPYLLSIQNKVQKPIPPSTLVSDTVIDVLSAISEREKERQMLQERLVDLAVIQDCLSQQFDVLKIHHSMLTNDLSKMRSAEEMLENEASILWRVPGWFIIDKITQENPTL